MQDIQRLAERLLTQPYGVTGMPLVAQLLPGHLPEDLPLDLPLPPEARVAGSVVRTSGGRLANAEIVLDVPGTEDEMLGFYQQELPALGWALAPITAGLRGGFMPAPSPLASTFCKGPQGPWVSVRASTMENQVSEVKVHVELTHPGPCAAPSREPSLVMQLLPSFTAPAGVPMRSTGGGGGGDGRFSEAVADTDLAAAVLEAHFAGQFAAAGWNRLSGGADGPHAWSLWRRSQDGDWQGLLLVLETPGQRQRTLYVRVGPANPSPMFGSAAIWHF